jgi:small nuclear ribonucleoprotein
VDGKSRWSSVLIMDSGRKPLDVLAKQLNAHILVVLKDGFEYRGKVVGCDHLMNVVLEEAVEYFGGRPTRSYGTILLRGNNIIYIIVL